MPMRLPRAIVRGGEPEIDLTPMIDCVFQLVIFFALVNEFSGSDLAKVALPLAPKAVTAERGSDDPSVVVVTIVDPSDPPAGFDASRPPIYMSGRQPSSMAVLRTWLREASDPIRHPDVSRPRVESAGGLRPSVRTLRVRCDRRQDFAWVQAVIAICGPVPGANPDREAAECPMLIKIDVSARPADEALPK